MLCANSFFLFRTTHYHSCLYCVCQQAELHTEHSDTAPVSSALPLRPRNLHDKTHHAQHTTRGGAQVLRTGSTTLDRKCRRAMLSQTIIPGRTEVSRHVLRQTRSTLAERSLGPQKTNRRQRCSLGGEDPQRWRLCQLLIRGTDGSPSDRALCGTNDRSPRVGSV